MPDKPVICRLNRDTIFGALMLAGIIAGFPIFGYFIQTVSPPALTVSLTIKITLGLLAITLIPILWCWWRCRLIANKQALEIRGIFYRKIIPWGTIHDYYLEWVQTESNYPDVGYMCIEFGARKFKFHFVFNHMAELREAIENNATNARARKFEIKEKLDIIEAPQIFEYGNPQTWPIKLAAAAMGILVLTSPYIGPITTGGINAIKAYFASYTLPMLLGFLAVSLLKAAMGSLLVLANIPRIKKAQEFADQRIYVSKFGLSWQRGADKIEIPWSQIERYYIESVPGHLQGSLCVVEGGRERITFLSMIPKGHVLRHLITQNASAASTTSWRYAAGRNSDLLGPAANPTADGKLVFHYKTRSNRAMLVFGLVLCLMFSIPIFIGNPAPINLLLFAIVGIPTSYCWLAYFRAKVEIDDEGIRHSTPLGQKFVAWSQIQSLKSATFYSIKGTKGTMRITQALAESDSFQEAITQRTGKIWERPTYEDPLRLGQ